MAAGAALVTSSARGFPEFTNDGEDALLVPPGDTDQLAGDLLRLLGDEELRHGLGLRAAENARRFEVATVAPRFAAELARLAS